MYKDRICGFRLLYGKDYFGHVVRGKAGFVCSGNTGKNGENIAGSLHDGALISGCRSTACRMLIR